MVLRANTLPHILSKVIQMSCAMGSNPNDSTRKEREVYATSAMGSNPNDSTRKDATANYSKVYC